MNLIMVKNCSVRLIFECQIGNYPRTKKYCNTLSPLYRTCKSVGAVGERRAYAEISGEMSINLLFHGTNSARITKAY